MISELERKIRESDDESKKITEVARELCKTHGISEDTAYNCLEAKRKGYPSLIKRRNAFAIRHGYRSYKQYKAELKQRGRIKEVEGFYIDPSWFDKLTAHYVPNSIEETENEQRVERKYSILDSLISTLTKQERSLIRLRFRENKNLVEIGDIIGKNKGSVHYILKKMLRKLHERAKKERLDELYEN